MFFYSPLFFFFGIMWCLEDFKPHFKIETFSYKNMIITSEIEHGLKQELILNP